jgi:hypothetical protein
MMSSLQASHEIQTQVEHPAEFRRCMDIPCAGGVYMPPMIYSMFDSVFSIHAPAADAGKKRA